MGRIMGTLTRDIGMLCWMAWSTTCPSLRFSVSSSLAHIAHVACRTRLETLPAHCLPYHELLGESYLKEKHWVYAILMAVMESLPVLYGRRTQDEILHSVLGKTYLGASSKLLDNLNDEIHTVDQALSSLQNYLAALTCGHYQVNEDSKVSRAESSACEMASWIYTTLNDDSPAFTWYVEDCRKLVNGQVASLNHKRTTWPSLAEYVGAIAEKSIGDVWIDIDLCQVDEVDSDTHLLKKSNEYIFKSSLLYDDVQDLTDDIETTSINSVLLLALERKIISEADLENLQPAQLKVLLQEAGIVDDIIHLADAFFLKGIYAFQDIETTEVDKKGLLYSFQLVRLFNFRKLLLAQRDRKTLKKVMASFSDLQSLRDTIPEEIGALVW
ncbi:MAG: hypothetical protein HXS52_10975 [Theionarchaea archaeon]|nr:hypothetical protein [Theionarchaea archaeon]MBU7038442.1 hypothetical protein [Theionarchaea archaeon]